MLLYDENKLDEMGKILDHYMKLVPTLKADQHVFLSNGSVIDIDNTQFFPIYFGGDQLTVARMHGIQALRDTHDTPLDRCEGVTPVIENWHARMALMKVRLHIIFMIHNMRVVVSCR